MNSASTPEPVRLRVRGVSDLLDLVPSLLGFHPRESLVLLAVDDDRVRVTARVDLPGRDDEDALAAGLDPLLCRFPAASWFLFAYSADADAAWVAVALAGSLLPVGARRVGVHVGAGRWYAAPGDPGRPHDPSCGALAAEAAYHGLRVLPDRSELERGLRPAASEAELEATLERVIATQPPATVARALRLATERMREPAPLTPEEGAVLAVAAFSPTFAESVVTGLDRGNAATAQQLWVQAVRAVPEYAGAAAALILGMAAWIGGEGALVNVCLERAASYAEEQPWFRFLDLVVTLALPPQEWPGVRAELLDRWGAA